MNTEDNKEQTTLESNAADEKLDAIFDEIVDEENNIANDETPKPAQAYIDLSSLNDGNQTIEKQQKATEKASKVLGSWKDKTVGAAKKVSSVVKDKTENSQALDKIKESSKAAVGKISANMNEKKAEKQELKPEKIILAPGEVKKYKLFFVSDMEEEADYLHQMSTNGMHFIKKAGIQYVFKTGEAKNYYYHLGYYEKDKRDGDRYTFNYEAAGWEKIYSEKGEFDGMWNYFRTEVDDDAPAPQIFSDRVSRIALYERLLSSWRSLLAMIIICLICMVVLLYVLHSKVGTISSMVLTFCILVSIIFLIIFAIYSRIYMKIKKKLIELKK